MAAMTDVTLAEAWFSLVLAEDNSPEQDKPQWKLKDQSVSHAAP
jgi:hypothetical protein